MKVLLNLGVLHLGISDSIAMYSSVSDINFECHCCSLQCLHVMSSSDV